MSLAKDLILDRLGIRYIDPLPIPYSPLVIHPKTRCLANYYTLSDIYDFLILQLPLVDFTL